MRTIDIHTHGIGGFDTRTGDTRHILNMARIHGSYGISEIIPAVYPGPIEGMRAHMQAVKEAMEQQKSAFSHQCSESENQQPETTNHKLAKNRISRILGVHLEGPFLNPARCGALDKVSFQQPTESAFKRLLEGFEDLVKIVTMAPELQSATRLIRSMCDMGIVVSMGHSDATYQEAEAGFQAGARGITHIFNAMRGFHHREPGIAGFGLLDPHVYIEVIADPFHLHPGTLALILKIKNPKRIIIVSDSVKETKTAMAFRGATGSHGTLQGGSTTITESAKILIEMGFEEDMIMQCITENPAAYLLGE